MKVLQYYNKNQFHIHDGLNDYLQSYNSLVVKIENYKERVNGLFVDKITLGRDWCYSKTTAKHVYMFLEEFSKIKFDGIVNKKAYIEKLIENGTIYYDEEMQ